MAMAYLKIVLKIKAVREISDLTNQWGMNSKMVALLIRCVFGWVTSLGGLLYSAKLMHLFDSLAKRLL